MLMLTVSEHKNNKSSLEMFFRKHIIAEEGSVYPETIKL